MTDNPVLCAAVSKVVSAFAAVCHEAQEGNADIYGFLRLIGDEKLGLTPDERAAVEDVGEEQLAGKICDEMARMREDGSFPFTVSLPGMCWRRQSFDQSFNEAGLSVGAKSLLRFLITLASQDLAPLAYTVEEIANKLKRRVDATRRYAEEAAAAGFLELDGELMTLIYPRARAA